MSYRQHAFVQLVGVFPQNLANFRGRSSAKISGAPEANARAIATRCCCPPESCRTLRRASAAVRPSRCKAAAASSLAVKATFSSGVR